MSQPVFSPLEAPTSDPFPAQALHACQVLAHLLQRVPRPESVQLFTAEHWSAPWLQIHLYPDPDDAQLRAYQQAFGGLVTRSRRDGDSRAVVYSELATEVERVRVQVWNVNESPLAMPSPRPPEPIADPPAPAVESADASDTVSAADTAPAAEPAEDASAAEACVSVDDARPGAPAGSDERFEPTDPADAS
ncbi:hypothetical protein [Streptacidiphilus neutrinimicus]|uniref:hypothetical protein n=1 Tax=Streptacidiphilus neutrinimicus TaxID=105420 RepID=UPI001269B430|nr:hypothetical protein [Streptacidiphilus neutrinimicus]